MTGRDQNAKALRLAAALAVVLAAGGCAGSREEFGAGALTPTTQYAVSVGQTPQEIALAVHPQGLSPNQQTALTAFYGRWRDNGGGDLTVKAPVGAADPHLARRSADLTLSFLERLGVPAASLRLVGYSARQAQGAPVIASFQKYEAIIPDCSQGWNNMTSTGSNRPFSHYGCAVTANMAAMIANPRDIVTPTPIDPSDGARREMVMDKYRQGVATSTAADGQASGAVSSK